MYLHVGPVWLESSKYLGADKQGKKQSADLLAIAGKFLHERSSITVHKSSF